MMRWGEAVCGSSGLWAQEPRASALSSYSSSSSSLSPSLKMTAAATAAASTTRKRRRRRSVYIESRVIEDITAVTQNKVLLGATVSAAIGQLSKPLTRLLFYGEDFDPKAALSAGGFPSSHSSAVAATATALAFERGLSDSIFGLSVVYAGLVMYDAQGVRREVGNHAKTMNRVLRREPVNLKNEPLTALLSEELEKQVLAAAAAEEEEDGSAPPPLPPLPLLKESVGHTEIEVIAGALLGVSVTLALHIIFPYS